MAGFTLKFDTHFPPCKNRHRGFFLQGGLAPPRYAVSCRSGGIGRRAWFRSMYPQGCGGSSPFFGTILLVLNHLPLWCPVWCPKLQTWCPVWCPKLQACLRHPLSARAGCLREFHRGRRITRCRALVLLSVLDASTSSRKSKWMGSGSFARPWLIPDA